MCLITNLVDLYTNMNNELAKIQEWCGTNKLSLNSKKTKYILFKPKYKHIHYPKFIFAGVEIERIGRIVLAKLLNFLVTG